MNATNDTWEQLPADLRGMVEAQLAAGETPLAWLELDLDTRLHYARGLLVLTDRRLIDVGPAEFGAGWCRDAGQLPFRSGRWRRSRPCERRNRTGVGALDLRGAESLLAIGGIRSAAAPQAHRLADRFERLRQGELAGGEETAEPPTTVCPSCGAILAADQKTCPDCGAVKGKPPSARCTG